ncbi:MAG: hypothetical protein IJ711_04290 [Lachnospiraceae bacterium]|nr:hypothetical protein [Lachnospiraceae bacterium]
MAEAKAKAIAKPVVKAAEAKAAEKAAVVKEEKKVETKKAADTKKTTEVKKTTAKKAPAKKAATATTAKKAEVKAAVNFQFAGKSYTTEDLVKIAKDVWVYDLNKDINDFKSVELYVKPEESAAYYVVNEEVTGCFGI